MEPLDYITIGSAVLNFLLGGTTVWSIIQWLSEKKLRKIEEKSKETSLETQRFEALTQQIEYQKQLIAEYISNEQARDELDDPPRLRPPDPGPDRAVGAIPRARSRHRPCRRCRFHYAGNGR